MKVEGASIEEVRAVVELLGLRLVEQKAKEGEVKFTVRPAEASNRWRAMTAAGRMKPSLCWHGHYLFMSRFLAAHPHATLCTWYDDWDFERFDNLALEWTRQQLRQTESYTTCDCDADAVAMALVPLSQLMKAAETIVSALRGDDDEADRLRSDRNRNPRRQTGRVGRGRARQ